MLKSEDVSKLASDILQAVDYDIWKEAINIQEEYPEEWSLLDEIEDLLMNKIADFVE